MADDIAQLRLVNRWLLDSITMRFPLGVRQYTMVQFNDPDVGPVNITNSKTEFDYFFQNLFILGGGDCPELAMQGLELALKSSPHNSVIIVFTDASAKDYADVERIKNIQLLLNNTKSQVIFVITGLCLTINDPQFLIYRNISSWSFGHVFQVELSDIGKVFFYLEHILSRPLNSSTNLLSKEYNAGSHSDNFAVPTYYTSILVTTDGLIYSISILGPYGRNVEISIIVSEIWGAIYVVKYPIIGTWTIFVYAGGQHSIRIQGLTAALVSSIDDCSKCHPNAICDEHFGRKCLCRDGFNGDGFNCSDINECAYSWTNNCTEGVCFNTIGSYTCHCPSGYNKSSTNICVDIDECSSPSLKKCHPNATCINLKGNYSCSCLPGYTGDGFYCELSECKSGMCGFGMDCTILHGEYNCSDPCMTYKSIYESWRSSSNKDKYSKMCDIGLHGWYRFLGSGGIRMPETCVSEYSCGADSPVWLSQTHPVLSDGIVKKTACAHWSSNCCHYSTDVQVKACPGGYHVYKFNGTPYCNLAYCTDPATAEVSGPCSCAANEECKVSGGIYKCLCKNGPNITDSNSLHHTLTCGKSEIKVSYRACELRTLNLDIENVHLMDKSCLGILDGNVSLLSLKTPVKEGKNTTHAIYSNNIYMKEAGIIERQELEVQYSCVYPLDMEVSLQASLKPMISKYVIKISGTGEFTIIMAAFKDERYLTPYEGTEIQLSTSSRLFIGMFIEDADNSTYILVMNNCFATPSDNPKDSSKYDIIQDGCPNKQDQTIKIEENGVSTQGKFSIQMFKFKGDFARVYLHCEIKLCNKAGENSCKPTCSGVRSRNSLSKAEEDNVIRFGPIVHKDSDGSSDLVSFVKKAGRTKPRVFKEASHMGIFPPVFHTVSIITILKPNKDRTKYESYRPISLINVDIKIFLSIPDISTMFHDMCSNLL
ncbi:uromodulin-like [Bombina bombina]|uniref:uromodulin-like n=1 Tax=Bombina bombina TaxID=8345 RepID=UPI00235B0CD6|nr:uromodulin-like [Bombina bombina]